MIGAGVASTLLAGAEWGICRVLPFKTDLALDVAVSLFSLAAPWIFDFANNAKARNTFIAMGAVGAVGYIADRTWRNVGGIIVRDFSA